MDQMDAWAVDPTAPEEEGEVDTFTNPNGVEETVRLAPIPPRRDVPGGVVSP